MSKTCLLWTYQMNFKTLFYWFLYLKERELFLGSHEGIVCLFPLYNKARDVWMWMICFSGMQYCWTTQGNTKAWSRGYPMLIQSKNISWYVCKHILFLWMVVWNKWYCLCNKLICSLPCGDLELELDFSDLSWACNAT